MIDIIARQQSLLSYQIYNAKQYIRSLSKDQVVGDQLLTFIKSYQTDIKVQQAQLKQYQKLSKIIHLMDPGTEEDKFINGIIGSTIKDIHFKQAILQATKNNDIDSVIDYIKHYPSRR